MLTNLLVERQRDVKVNPPHRANARKRKIIPRDDMGPSDTSGRDAGDGDCVPT
jgi:hypothetical protein